MANKKAVKTKRLQLAEKVLFETAEMYYANRIEPNAENEIYAACREYAQAKYKVRDKKLKARSING